MRLYSLLLFLGVCCINLARAGGDASHQSPATQTAGRSLTTTSVFTSATGQQPGAAETQNATQVAAVPPSATASPAKTMSSKSIAPPVTYRASYTASYNGLPINTLRILSKDNDGYRLTTVAENFIGKISEEERLSLSSTGEIIPHDYHYKRSIFGKKRTETTSFKPDQQLVINTYKGKTVELPLEKSLLAPLSYQLQLRQDLLAGKEDFTYRVIYRNAVRDYHYKVIRSETLATPIGKLETLVIQRIRDSNERETFLWLAKSLDYLPVKLLQKEDGESYEMLIETYKTDAT